MTELTLQHHQAEPCQHPGGGWLCFPNGAEFPHHPSMPPVLHDELNATNSASPHGVLTPRRVPRDHQNQLISKRVRGLPNPTLSWELPSPQQHPPAPRLHPNTQHCGASCPGHDKQLPCVLTARL